MVLDLVTENSSNLQQWTLALTEQVKWSEKPDPGNWLFMSSPSTYMFSFDRILQSTLVANNRPFLSYMCNNAMAKNQFCSENRTLTFVKFHGNENKKLPWPLNHSPISIIVVIFFSNKAKGFPLGKFPTRIGVPQKSILSVTIFKPKINITKCFNPETNDFLYVEDSRFSPPDLNKSTEQSVNCYKASRKSNNWQIQAESRSQKVKFDAYIFTI